MYLEPGARIEAFRREVRLAAQRCGLVVDCELTNLAVGLIEDTPQPHDLHCIHGRLLLDQAVASVARAIELTRFGSSKALVDRALLDQADAT